MDMNDYAVRVTGLKKSYQMIPTPWGRFQYYVFRKKCGETFYALDDISFSVKKGETFGIIGTNGSGKSTLLQIISGIIPATSGTVEVSGKVSALLELGSGFNPESSGYENIYLNAAILGVSKEQIEKKCDEIIQFADIGSFINEPVKTYSSGMFIRLAFAVAINVEADIIIIDEALAVGDIFFRQKCYAKLNELKSQGKTIILVSHGMNEVEQFCDRALLLSHGRQIMLGDSGNVVQKYYMINQGEPSVDEKEQVQSMVDREDELTLEQPGFFEENWNVHEQIFLDLTKSTEQNNGSAHYLKVGLFDKTGKARRVFKQGEDAYFYTEIMIDKDIEVPINGVVLVNQKNIIIHGKNSFQTDCKLPQSVKKGSIIKNCIKVELEIEEGEYTFEVGFTMLPVKIYERRSMLPHPELAKYEVPLADRRNVGAFAIQGSLERGISDLKFYGITDLNDRIESCVLESACKS